MTRGTNRNLIEHRMASVLTDVRNILELEQRNGLWATQDKSYIAQRLNLLRDISDVLSVYWTKHEKEVV